MSPERWKQIEEVFQAALDTAPPERPRYVEQACAGDEELRREVEALLAQYESAGDFIDEPVYEQSGMSGFSVFAAFGAGEGEAMVGRRVGAYRVLREIGRGGMGMVYLAERDDNVFRRRVAVKLVKRGMDTDFILRRFRHERQILAALDHPYITRIFDGGSTEDGRPYFVMEYVEGEPFYAYCDARRLGTPERLRLFARVCEAVEYAHQRQVIHRDLKPSNILVTKDGAPKLFDFGIGKLLDPALASDTAPVTATAMRLMTIEYASPEQVQGHKLTFASDVYSLGVLLYELLTGHRPYRFRDRSPIEMSRVVVEEMPEQPSLAVSRTENLLPFSHVDSEAWTVGHLAEMRGMTPDGLRRELSGDLDNITMRALRKDPAQRYQTAAALREDILRHLDGRAVSAPFYFSHAQTARTAPADPHAPAARSIAVLPLKLLRLGAAGGDTTDGFLSVGLADALITRLSNARSLVVRPTSAVLRYSDEAVNPFQAGRELGVGFVLDGRIKLAGRRIRVSLQLLDVSGETTAWANQFDAEFTDALELEDAISKQVVEALVPRLTGEERRGLDGRRGTDNPRAFEAYLRGRYFWNQFTAESLPKALESFESAVALDPDYASAYIGLADFYLWANIYGLLPSPEALRKAEEYARRAIELDGEAGEAYASLGLVKQNRREWEESGRLYARAIELSPNYVHAHEWNAASMIGQGRREEGIAEITLAERLDPLSVRTKALTAWTLYQTRRFDEALEKGRQILELDKNYPQGHSQVGLNLLATGRTEEALAAFRKFDELIPDSALAKYQLCFALVAAGRRSEARKVLEDVKKLAAGSHVKPFFLAMSHAALDERDEAFRYFEMSLAEYDPWIIWLGTEPMLDPLREDPRFVELFRRTNNPLAEKQAALAGRSNAGRAHTGEKMIAVLPFKLIGPRPDEGTGDDYLSIGLADALINRLSNLQRLVVRPTSSVLRLDADDPAAAGRELEVGFVIDGTIRRAGDRIRVTAQLLDVRENSVRWSEKFDERITDVLELEDSISERVVKSLLPRLTGEEERRLSKRGTDSPAAYQAYLRGRYFATQFSEDALVKSLEAYREAVRLDPAYALPHVGIAEFYVWTAIMGAIRTRDAYPLAKEELRLALAADDSLAEALSLSAFIAMLYDWNWAEAGRLIRRALDINPNYYAAHDAYAHILASQGEFDEAVAEIRRAEELDPLSPRSKIMVSCISYQARRFDLSAAKAEEAIKMEGNSPQGFLHLGNALIHGPGGPRAAEALTVSVNAWGKTAMNKFMLCFALVADGRREEAERVFREILQLAETQYVKSYFVAMAHVALGRIDEAFDWFEKSIRERDDWMLWFGTDIKLDPLRSDPRYFEILRKIGNPIIARQLTKRG